MKTWFSLVALLTVATLSAQSRTEEFTFHSSVLGEEKTCSVYLPAGYDSTDTRYPVLYLLHGAGGYHRAWIKAGNVCQIADEAIASGMAVPMIIVMPDASGQAKDHTGPRMGYFDVPGWSYERFFFEEFLPAVEARYRIRAEKSGRAIAGLSMGGGGTAVYALHHPELFGSACPLSALLDTFSGLPDYDPVFSRSVAANSPVAILREMSDSQAALQRSVRWWVDCGDDDFLWQGNIDFYTLMRRREIPLQYRMRDGSHTWRYWQTALNDVLTFCSIGFGR